MSCLHTAGRAPWVLRTQASKDSSQASTTPLSAIRDALAVSQQVLYCKFRPCLTVLRLLPGSAVTYIIIFIGPHMLYAMFSVPWGMCCAGGCMVWTSTTANGRSTCRWQGLSTQPQEQQAPLRHCCWWTMTRATSVSCRLTQTQHNTLCHSLLAYSKHTVATSLLKAGLH